MYDLAREKIIETTREKGMKSDTPNAFENYVKTKNVRTPRGHRQLNLTRGKDNRKKIGPLILYTSI